MERELKLGLHDPEGIDALLRVLPNPIAVLEQTNHFFSDLAGDLARARTMLRVRENNRLDTDATIEVILTVKRRTAAKDGYFVAEETECALNLEDWREVRDADRPLGTLNAGPLEALKLTSPLRCHGVMRNTRHVILCEGFTLEVDRTELPGGRIDAEVEVETDDAAGARALVEDKAKEAGVTLFPQTTGKYARFLASLS